LDFVSGQVIGQSPQWYPLINVIDECSGKCLWVEAAREMLAKKVVSILDNLLEMGSKSTQSRMIEGLNVTLKRECLNLNWFSTAEELEAYLEK
jgi:putative transposase